MCFFEKRVQINRQAKKSVKKVFSFSRNYATLYVKLTMPFLKRIRALERLGRIGRMNLPIRVSTSGGSTKPNKKFLQTCTAEEKQTLYSYSLFPF